MDQDLPDKRGGVPDITGWPRAVNLHLHVGSSGREGGGGRGERRRREERAEGKESGGHTHLLIAFRRVTFHHPSLKRRNNFPTRAPK